MNNAANVRYMSGGQVKVPIVLRGGNGIAHQLGATHSHRVETIYARIPGLIVVCPSTAYEAKGLLKSRPSAVTTRSSSSNPRRC